MTRIDNWLIDRCQRAYDYLWDRWGIFTGQVGQVAMVVDLGLDCVRGKASVLGAICIIFVTALLELRNYQQKRGFYTALNNTAADFRDRPLRWVRWGFFASLLPLNVLASGWLGLASFILFCIFSYSYCLMIRDRDEGRFKKHKLAYQEGGA